MQLSNSVIYFFSTKIMHFYFLLNRFLHIIYYSWWLNMYFKNGKKDVKKVEFVWNNYNCIIRSREGRCHSGVKHFVNPASFPLVLSLAANLNHSRVRSPSTSPVIFRINVNRKWIIPKETQPPPIHFHKLIGGCHLYNQIDSGDPVINVLK